MGTPATTHRTITHDELRQKYTDNGWEERLQDCEVEINSEPGHGETLEKTRYRYRDRNENVIAVTFRYRRRDGERFVVRMLRDGDTAYSGPIGLELPRPGLQG